MRSVSSPSRGRHQNHGFGRVEAAETDLGLDGEVIRRKRVLLQENLRAISGGTVEAHHHQDGG